MHLVVVESPAKASTIKKYLGPDYEVLASYGHVRDLLPKSGAVRPEDDFSMRYELIEKNTRHVEAIARAMKKADSLLLATDLDREGEAISWHLSEILAERRLIGKKPVRRIVFHEITKGAIREAVETPRDISMDLVNAQQARRALDYLVGFNLSPLLWKKIGRGLSAGRVQSPALRLICEREQSIRDFLPREYWTIEAAASTTGESPAPVHARLLTYGGEKVEQFSVTNGEDAERWRATLLASADGRLHVMRVERKQRRRQPAPPFITSTLQQEAVRKLGFSASRTMRVAQQLYEGVDIGSESVGLITYMRTDSTTLANEALEEIRAFVRERYGADDLPGTARVYRTKSKNAQEAHEAIRPTSVRREPRSLQKYLSSDQFRLYDLIWKRTVACQMEPALIDTVAVDLGCGAPAPEVGAEAAESFRATGSTVASPGFMRVYSEGRDDDGSAEEEEERRLPPLEVGQVLQLADVLATQHHTEPPPRYTEASLVKALEEFGIGRPSTYASIIQTLVAREYVELDARRFRATDVGMAVNRFLTEHFAPYVDYQFTAELEDELDAIARGEKDWKPAMADFWHPFIERVREKDGSVTRAQALQARELGTDPQSGLPVSVRLGRFGPFVQVGSVEGSEKPRFFGLRPGQRMDTITLAEALELTRLPRDLGPSSSGERVLVGIGRFGPYVRHGDRYVSLKAEDDPYTIDLARAEQLIAEKNAADAARVIRVFDDGLRVLNGRWGPYVTDGTRNARVPKDRDAGSLGAEEARALLDAAPRQRRAPGTSNGKSRPQKQAASARPASRPPRASSKKPLVDGATAAEPRRGSTAKGPARSATPATRTTRAKPDDASEVTSSPRTKAKNSGVASRGKRVAAKGAARASGGSGSARRGPRAVR